MNIMRIVAVVTLVAAGVLGGGCAGECSSRDRVVYLLEAGRACQAAGDVAESRRCFDEVHEMLRPYLDTKPENRVTEGVTTTLVNQTMAEYKGAPSERTMASALNALNLIALRDLDAARIELNRAADWQQDTKNRFAAEIEARNRKNEEAAKEKGVSVSREHMLKVDEKVASHFENIENLQGYAEFANPFINHLRGIYYLAAGSDMGDRDTARFEFRQVAGMTPEARPMLEADLLLADSAGGRPTPTTWVYFFTGLAPRLEELYIPIPIPVGGVNFVSAAFPVMKFDDDFAQVMVVRASGAAVETTLLADMDRIVASEFRTRLPTIILQEVLSSTIKAAAAWAAKKQNIWAQLVAMGYQAASTAADLRTWRTLPKRIGFCRIPTPADGRLEFEAGRPIGACAVVPGTCNIVLVTLPASRTPSASILTAPFQLQAVAAPTTFPKANTR